MNADIAVNVGAGGAGGYWLVAVLWGAVVVLMLRTVIREVRESDAAEDALDRQVWR